MNSRSILLAIDQGTTGTKVLALSPELQVLAEAYSPFQQHFPQPGWVEHDLDQIWTSVQQSLAEVLKHVSATEIVAIGITNQRETLGFWERHSLRPLAHAIVWQDRRTAEFCSELKARGLEPLYREKTGLLLDPYFSGTKLGWALQNLDPVSRSHQSGALQVGTIDTYLIAKLTAGTRYVTDPSNASRTLCMDLRSTSWSEELCEPLGFATSLLPEILNSCGEFGRTRGVPGLPDGIPITGVLGDQQSALFGQTCFEAGTAKCTYGTGAFLLMNTGAKPLPSKHGLLTTVAWKIAGKTTYALEGSAFIAGAAVQWLRDGLGIIRESREIEALAESVPSTDGVYFVPALTGLGAPYWDPKARGVICGITRGTTKAHLSRATLEGIVLQNTDILSAMQSDLGSPLRALRVDGGAASNGLLMQLQADALLCNLQRPKITQTTALGATFAAGLGVGVWSSTQELERSWKLDREFAPKMDSETHRRWLEGWKRAVSLTRASS